MKRVFLIVLDSFGIGELPDAADYGDEGSNTLSSCSESAYFRLDNLRSMGLFNIDNIDCSASADKPSASYARLAEASKGKDTTTGHWEMTGLILDKPFPVFPDGFPHELIKNIEHITGRKIICNKSYSGTKVIIDYGIEHINTGALIVYTSADSVLQVAAHEDVIPLEELYEYCEKIRELCIGKYAVGRVIARPFTGCFPDYIRTSGRHDYSLKPFGKTMLNYIKDAGQSVLSVGKIVDIFNGEGITEYVKTENNSEGIDRTIEFMQRDFEGLCFVNLVDFDMLYGHRNDVNGYAKALTYFDKRLTDIVNNMRQEDILLITADHGCDPGTESTDHSREYVPLLIYGHSIKPGINLGTRSTFADIGATVLDYLKIEHNLQGSSFISDILA